ncbi:MAG: sigma-70 family RNA polymerase sigma factor [Sedimentisphaerales bacterium]|jgi:RNA polymerase sigma factor (sigma-70 family)
MEDRLLVIKCKLGSKGALKRIYEKYKEDLLILAMALVNNPAAAEDVVHDVFTGFVRDIGDFRLTGSLKGYLRTCVANRARNINKAKRYESIETNSVMKENLDFNEPVNSLVCNEQLLLLKNAMAQLPYDQREVIMMHVHADMTFEKIAKSQGISVNTIKSRYRYGIDKLKTILNGEVIK